VSDPRATDRIHQPRLAVVVATLFLLVGLVPLPQLVPGATGYWPEMGRYWICATLLTLVPVAALAAMPLGAVHGFPARCAALLLRPRPLAFAALVAAAVTALSVGLSVYAWHRAPTTADEIAQLWQARILLHGRFWLPADPNFEFFAVENVVDHGRWYSQFPVGGALVLVAGALIHAPWLVNPVLSGLTGAGLYHVTRRAFGELEGRATAVVYACSPSVLLMSATYMNHVPVLFLTVAALAGLVQWERTATRTGRRTYAALIGLSLGCIAAIRPLDAVVVSLAIAACQVAVVRPKRTRRLSLLLQVIVGSLGVAVLLVGNWKTTGSPFRFGYEVLWGPASRLGFHMDPQGIPHTPLRALLLSIKYVGELNASLLGWPVPSILIVVLALLTLRRVTRWDALLLGLFVAQLFAYAFYWHDGEFLGPRYLYTALPTLIILIARAPSLLAARVGGYWRHAAPLLAMACVVVAWAVPMPPYGAWGMVQMSHDSSSTFKLDLEGAVRADNIHHALALVHEPFSGRLVRRLWGVGMSRGDAARVFANGDACSVLEAVRTAESDSTSPPDLRATMVMTRVRPFSRDSAGFFVRDPLIRISSEKSITPACQAELDEDARYGGMPFGPALLLEPIGADGTLDGDVVYASDLGERNASLRPRFGDRTWYRVWVDHAPDGTLRPVITRY
jgi:hypothetical protein